MSWIDKLTGKSVNFIAPEGLSANQEVLFPCADVQSVAYASEVTLEVTQMLTIVTVAQMTGALTLKASVDSQVSKGARLLVKLTSDATARTVTLSDGFTGTTIAGVISKTKYADFVYDGSKFIHIGTNQID